MDEKLRRAYERLLDPAVLRPRIIEYSLFIALFEAFKDGVEDRLLNFFATDFTKDGALPSDRYRTEVLARHRSPIYATLAWFVERGALVATDIDCFDQIRQCRNAVTHQFLKILSTDNAPPGFQEHFQHLIRLSDQIDRWWVKEIEVPTNPDFDGQTVRDEDIVPGTTMMTQLLLDVALGDENRSRYYIEQWKRQFPRHDLPNSR